MHELFIYYRATTENASTVHALVHALHADLRARHPGLQARVLRRPEPADGLHTWMEIYALPLKPDGVSAALQLEIENTAQPLLAPWLAGPRHTEVFQPCA